MFRVETILDKEKWKNYVLSCVNFNVFSSFEWGEFKSDSWQVERIAFFKKNTFVGATQVLFKNIFGYKFGWSSSGINLINYKYLPQIIEALESHYNFKKTAIRFNFFDSSSGQIRFQFDEVDSLKKVKNTINSGYTVRFWDLERLDIPKDFSSNNRYYFRQSLKNELSFKLESLSKISEFVSLHNEMTSNKSLDKLRINVDLIRKLRDSFGEKLKLFSVRCGDEIISSCLIIEYEKYCYYFLAAANEKGRHLNASFFMIKNLLNYYKSNSIFEFDFGGITPFNPKAKGVNRFKMGFGGNVINYVGERNLCRSKILNYLFNIIISKIWT